MIVQILSRTPIWVWLILAFLLYRGLLASRDREMPLPQMFIVPVVFLWLSLDGIGRSFGWQDTGVLAWLVGVAVGIGVVWVSFDPGRMTLHVDRKTVFVRGSWMPLLLMMAIFLTKYAAAIMLAMQPARAQDASFSLTVCFLYGVCNSLLLAQLLRALCLQQPNSS